MKNSISLTVVQLYNLQAEVAAVLAERVSVSVRYRFLEIKKKLEILLEVPTQLRNELVKKYGEEKDGQVFIMPIVDGLPNPKLKQFNEEWELILKEAKEFEYSPVPMELIEKIETNQPIEVLFKLL